MHFILPYTFHKYNKFVFHLIPQIIPNSYLLKAGGAHMERNFHGLRRVKIQDKDFTRQSWGYKVINCQPLWHKVKLKLTYMCRTNILYFCIYYVYYTDSFISYIWYY